MGRSLPFAWRRAAIHFAEKMAVDHHNIGDDDVAAMRRHFSDAEFLELAATYERVALDTTMAFTPFFDEMGGAYPPELLPRLRDLGLAGKVHLGSDFPNIPYDYAEQLDALARLDLGDDWLRAVCWESSDALLGGLGQ